MNTQISQRKALITNVLRLLDSCIEMATTAAENERKGAIDAHALNEELAEYKVTHDTVETLLTILK